MTARIVFRCPAMPVVSKGLDLKETTELPCPLTLTMDDGTELEGIVTFPVTSIRRDGLLHWTVDACTASGWFDEVISTVYVTLEPEGVLGPYAMPVKAHGALSCSYGYGRFSGTWPGVFAMPEDGEWIVNPVTAEFEVIWQ